VWSIDIPRQNSDKVDEIAKRKNMKSKKALGATVEKGDGKNKSPD
jgi:hypothetical protein